MFTVISNVLFFFLNQKLKCMNLFCLLASNPLVDCLTLWCGMNTLGSLTSGQQPTAEDDWNSLPLSSNSTLSPFSLLAHPQCELTPKGAAQPNADFGRVLHKQNFSEANRLLDATAHCWVSFPLLPPMPSSPCLVLFFLYFSLSFLPRSPPSFMLTTLQG